MNIDYLWWELSNVLRLWWSDDLLWW